jgi:uncharacterized peroxidase-related enzyme
MKHHGAGLHQLIKNEKIVEGLKKDFRTSDIDEKDLVMLEYVAKLTLEPWNMTEDDVIKLREKDFSDEAILDICQVTGYYAFVNRLADGLGVELEHYWD